MENLKKALSKLLNTTEAFAKAYEDKKISTGEWIGIAYSSTGLIWITKNLDKIFSDIKNATEDSFQAMLEQVKGEFDIPNDELEEKIEMALSVVLNIIVLVWGKENVNQILANVGRQTKEERS